MTDRLILTILIALACPLLLPVVIEEEDNDDYRDTTPDGFCEKGEE